MTDFGRVLTAMVTPMDSENNIDWPAVRQLANYLVDNGSDGLVVCGTTGESPTLSNEEKLQLFKAVVDAVGDRAKVVAGTGCNDTLATIRLSQAAEKTGVHGLMLVVPYYNKPSQDALYDHFRLIAHSVSLPIILYNVPSRTVTNLLPVTVERLARIANIVAIKEACGVMDQVSELRIKLGADFPIYSGDDSLTLPMLALGGYGVISVASHLVGNELQEMISAFVDGNSQRAADLHRQLFPLFKALFVTTNPIPVKAALNLKGIKVGGLRPPLQGAKPDELKILRETMSELGLSSS